MAGSRTSRLTPGAWGSQDRLGWGPLVAALRASWLRAKAWGGPGDSKCPPLWGTEMPLQGAPGECSWEGLSPGGGGQGSPQDRLQAFRKAPPRGHRLACAFSTLCFLQSGSHHQGVSSLKHALCLGLPLLPLRPPDPTGAWPAALPETPTPSLSAPSLALGMWYFFHLCVPSSWKCSLWSWAWAVWQPVPTLACLWLLSAGTDGGRGGW